DETAAIQAAANRHLDEGLRRVERVPVDRAFASGDVELRDLVSPYVEDLAEVVDLDRVVAAGVRVGVDPLGGSALPYLAPLARSDETAAIQAAANRHLDEGLRRVERVPVDRAFASGDVELRDLVSPYVEDLAEVVDLDRVVAAGVRVGVDPLGGSALPYLAPLAERYGLDLEVISDAVDPAFGFMHVDHDGKV